ncbi:hypothetical protein C8F04DRAFT_1270566 [Mycena alexandri]|uniref:Uncharacterized protein n=1 Tax=Mycena alexandri TaxID=1745969 RepID=A0AAD6SDP8_9AGAR|nr:hypothetical protein C8F04DRAFT_1270566 [Mycena alexandri]
MSNTTSTQAGAPGGGNKGNGSGARGNGGGRDGTGKERVASEEERQRVTAEAPAARTAHAKRLQAQLAALQQAREAKLAAVKRFRIERKLVVFMRALVHALSAARELEAIGDVVEDDELATIARRLSLPPVERLIAKPTRCRVSGRTERTPSSDWDVGYKAEDTEVDQQNPGVGALGWGRPVFGVPPTRPRVLHADQPQRVADVTRTVPRAKKQASGAGKSGQGKKRKRAVKKVTVETSAQPARRLRSRRAASPRPGLGSGVGTADRAADAALREQVAVVRRELARLDDLLERRGVGDDEEDHPDIAEAKQRSLADLQRSRVERSRRKSRRVVESEGEDEMEVDQQPERESATPERQLSAPRAPFAVPQTPAVTPGPDAVREVAAPGPRIGRSERLAPPKWEAHQWPKVEPVDAPIPGGSGAPMRSIIGAHQVARELFPGTPERGTSTRTDGGMAGSTEGGAGALPAELKAEPLEGEIPGGNADVPPFDLAAEQEVIAGEMRMVWVLGDDNDMDVV